jgi:hypothetical protein
MLNIGELQAGARLWYLNFRRIQTFSGFPRARGRPRSSSVPAEPAVVHEFFTRSRGVRRARGLRGFTSGRSASSSSALCIYQLIKAIQKPYPYRPNQF